MKLYYVSTVCYSARRRAQSDIAYFPVDEVTVSVDEGTGKSVFIDRELGMSIPGFWDPQTQQVECPPFTVWTRPIELASKTKPSARVGVLAENVSRFR